MSVPNEFVPPTPHPYHEGATPLVIQAAHSNSNFPSVNANGAFNGGGFFANSIGYDVAMLPLFHTSQRPAHFNTFAHQKQTADTKEELLAPQDARAVFNNEPTNSPPIQSVYWSRQSQLSPFGVLPHEISPEHIEPEPKSPYDNVLGHFTPQNVNNLNHMNDCVDRDKKTQVIVSGKSKEMKKYIAKPVNDVKMPMASYDDVAYRNGVINHGGHVNKVDHKLINSTYKSPKPPEPVELPVESMNPVPRDYRVFKPPPFQNSSVPVVKFTGKPPKQYIQKQMKPPQSSSPVLKNRMNANGSPLIHKMEFHEDSQSSPISLTSDDINGHYQQPEVASMKENEAEFHGMNHIGPIAHAPGYREQMSDMNCQDKNKVTQPFLKLPYMNAGNVQNNVADRNRTSFPPLYIAYNTPHNPPAVASAPPQMPKRQPEKPVLSERVDQVKMMHDGMPKPQQNGLVGYSSVIMRTDRNYEAEKLDKSPRRMIWSDERPVANAAPTVKNDKMSNYNPKDTNHVHIQPPGEHILLGLTERQHSYFDTTPCPTQVNPQMNKCPPKTMTKMYDDTRLPEHPQVTQEPIHYQYMAANVKPMPVPTVEPEPEKPYRKRKASKNMPPENARVMPEYPARDPPPAHVNLYQQPLQSSGYMMDNTRYDMAHMPKMYPNDQFYNQVPNNYPMNNIPQEPTHHQTVISSHANPQPRPSNSPQIRNVPAMPPTLPLSAYFSSFHPSNAHYPHHEYPAEQYEAQNFQEKKELYDGRSKVVVPNIEEEFKFLFDPSTPNFKQIAAVSEEEELYKKAAAKNTFYRKNVDFLAGYIKFLENNCESTETLTDSNSSNIKTWNRNKVVYQPVVRENEPEPPKEQPKPKEPETNFENDPRYYPLPKSSDKRRLESSDEECGEFEKKKQPKKATEEKKKTVVKKETKSEKKPKTKKAKMKKEHEEEPNSVKSKLEKLEKAKQKIARLQMKVEKKKHKADKIKPKMEKAMAEIRAIKQSGLQKPKPAKDVKEQKSVPRRKVSERKAKDEFMLKQQIQGAIDSEDELHTDSDSDPSWTPRADDEEAPKRKSTRIRSVRFKSKTPKKSDFGSFKQNFTSSGKKEASSTQSSIKESSKNSRLSENSHKLKPFYVLKKEASTKHPSIWRLQEESRLQKFEYFEQDGRHLYRSTLETAKFTESDKSKYHEVETLFIEERNDKLIVELCDDTEIPTDLKIKENFMKESLCYEHQFAVYIQTLVSQALDSNFLSEIVKENDVYFLNNMKVIDDVTATYLSDLTGVVRWKNNSVNILVKTWPFISIKSIRGEPASTLCSSCTDGSVKQTAIFYGQPYQRDTLLGSKPNSGIPDDMDKTIDLCKCCAREVKLFNKIWHQKYHVFVDCAKYVSKKKADDKVKGTTDILNELLADTTWLSKLFYEIRNTWLQIWTIVQKTKES